MITSSSANIMSLFDQLTMYDFLSVCFYTNRKCDESYSCWQHLIILVNLFKNVYNCVCLVCDTVLLYRWHLFFEFTFSCSFTYHKVTDIAVSVVFVFLIFGFYSLYASVLYIHCVYRILDMLMYANNVNEIWCYS